MAAGSCPVRLTWLLSTPLYRALSACPVRKSTANRTCQSQYQNPSSCCLRPAGMQHAAGFSHVFVQRNQRRGWVRAAKQQAPKQRGRKEGGWGTGRQKMCAALGHRLVERGLVGGSSVWAWQVFRVGQSSGVRTWQVIFATEEALGSCPASRAPGIMYVLILAPWLALPPPTSATHPCISPAHHPCCRCPIGKEACGSKEEKEAGLLLCMEHLQVVRHWVAWVCASVYAWLWVWVCWVVATSSGGSCEADWCAHV